MLCSQFATATRWGTGNQWQTQMKILLHKCKAYFLKHSPRPQNNKILKKIIGIAQKLIE